MRWHGTRWDGTNRESRWGERGKPEPKEILSAEVPGYIAVAVFRPDV
ncbi:unnamed protein product, partial [Ectocarpus sp. 13 AM-2016]